MVTNRQQINAAEGAESEIIAHRNAVPNLARSQGTRKIEVATAYLSIEKLLQKFSSPLQARLLHNETMKRCHASAISISETHTIDMRS